MVAKITWITKQYTLSWWTVLTKFPFSIALLIPEPVDEEDKEEVEAELKKKVEVKKEVEVKEEPLTGTKGKEGAEVADAGKCDFGKAIFISMGFNLNIRIEWGWRGRDSNSLFHLTTIISLID